MLISKNKHDELKEKKDLTNEELDQIKKFDDIEFTGQPEEQPEIKPEAKQVLIEDDKELTSKVNEREKNGKEAKEQLMPPKQEREDDGKSNIFLYAGFGVVFTGVLAYILLRDDKKAEKGAEHKEPINEPKLASNSFNNDFTS